MSLNKIAYFIADRLNEPTNSVLVEEIKFAVNYWRDFLLRQDIEKNGQSGETIQTITIPLQLVDKADNCYIELGCSILKTIVKVPMPLNIKGDSPFNYVGAANLIKPYGYRNQSTVAFSFTGKNHLYTFNNGYIYLYGNNKLDYVTLSGVFSNPTEAVELCIDTANCLGDDEPYPISSHLRKIIIEGILSNTFALRPLANEILTRDAVEN